MVISRFEIHIVSLNPAVGSEIRKSRPCIIISPDEMNKYLGTVIVAPMTSAVKEYPSRVKCKFKGKTGQIALDQIRTVSKERLKKKLGMISEEIQNNVLEILQKMFSF